jgi:adenylate cyclase
LAEAAPASLLIVDDEVRILTALRRSLRREGWEILVAESPADALRILEERAVDLILSDQKMPGMSGLELLAEVCERHPRTRRMLITGWTEEVPPEKIAELGIRALIPKPWDDAELKGLLRAELS